MEPVYNIIALPREGHRTHDELFEEDTFIGSVEFLISPVHSDRFLPPVLPLILPVLLTIPYIPSYAWVGATPPQADSPAPKDSSMPDTAAAAAPASVAEDSSEEEEDPSEGSP